jgi:hypothetical protein
MEKRLGIPAYKDRGKYFPFARKPTSGLTFLKRG